MTAFKDRIIERKQGCWNCVHFDRDKAKKLWWDEARGHMLHKAVEIAVSSPKGENDQRVKNIRVMVPGIDKAIEDGTYGVCRIDKGTSLATAPADQKGNFVADAFLCPKWTAAQGASIARAGAAPDMLPDELQDRFDTDRPAGLTILNPQKPGENEGN